MIKWYLIQEIKTFERPVLAVDIGGTKILLALISRQGEVVTTQTLNTQAGEGPQAVIDRLISGIDNLLEECRLSPRQLNAISIACAGVIDMKQGLVITSPNLPGWDNMPLRNVISQRYRLPAFLLNDADAAALGEYRFGAGQGLNTVIALTVGTGIGGGIIINSELYTGATASAAEIGHMVIEVNGPQCACGNRGCLEALASGSAIAREAKSRLRQGEESSLIEMSAGQIDNITAETVHNAARDGDIVALEVIAQAAFYLGIGITNLVNLLNPEMVIIGGSLAQMGDLLFEPVKRVVSERAMPLLAQSVRIVPAQLGNEAGVFGAAVYALEH